MRSFIFAILLLSISYAATFGYSRVTIERVWTIEDSQNGTFEFNGALVANNSNQRVVSLSTEPEMEYFDPGDGTIHLHYNGTVVNGTMILKARAIVNVDYNTNISADGPIPEVELNYTNLTEPDGAISLQAWSLAHEDSSLATIRDLANWVHSAVKYDISYWSKSKSAKDVFAERRGVCVEYTHLLISMARSLGFDTRYVSGYVQSNSWQPHAWAEIYVPGYGWLPVDATFGQVGILDSSHLAIHYGQDQSTVYDELLTMNPDASIMVTDDVTAGFFSEDPKGISLSMEVDPQSYIADVKVENTRPEYVYGTSTFALPEGYGGTESSIVLLAPYESLDIFHGLNHSLIQDGYAYEIQMAASFNDAKDKTTLSINESNDWNDENNGTGAASPCPSTILLLIPAAFMLRR
ncbi:MAG: transglutaminase-like domain-containing protein [Candidatus ainarchaeum sp.]|nr:transglutaminase-like domain-containing protein [Candidatus ainarchaeum sp.]